MTVLDMICTTKSNASEASQEVAEELIVTLKDMGVKRNFDY